MSPSLESCREPEAGACYDLESLFRAKVPACQITVEELKEDLESSPRLSGESSTAPLILRAKVGKLNLLHVGLVEILVRNVVLTEAGARGPTDPVFQKAWPTRPWP